MSKKSFFFVTSVHKRRRRRKSSWPTFSPPLDVVLKWSSSIRRRARASRCHDRETATLLQSLVALLELPSLLVHFLVVSLRRRCRRQCLRLLFPTSLLWPSACLLRFLPQCARFYPLLAVGIKNLLHRRLPVSSCRAGCVVSVKKALLRYVHAASARAKVV